MNLKDSRFTAEVAITIPFHDVDLMGVAWHGHYVRYIEVAREALLNQLGFGYRAMFASDYVWPVIDFQIKYRHALLFEQTVLVTASLKEYENRLVIGYEIRDKETNKRLTTAQTVQVAVHAKTRELCLVTPKILLEKMGLTECAG